jgi:hypothetical protein
MLHHTPVSKYWSLATQEWEKKGQQRLASTFAKSYVNTADYSGWYYSVSGLPGAVLDNNPIELHNKSIKGSSDMSGMITIQRNMFHVLNDEFPKLVYLMTEKNGNGPTLCCPVRDQQKPSIIRNSWNFNRCLNSRLTPANIKVVGW